MGYVILSKVVPYPFLFCYITTKISEISRFLYQNGDVSVLFFLAKMSTLTCCWSLKISVLVWVFWEAGVEMESEMQIFIEGDAYKE